MTLYLVQGPQAEPINKIAAKLHLRVTASDEDALIESYIAAARGEIEGWTGRAMVAQTWDLKFDCFPAHSDTPVELPWPPLLSVESITYVDTAGDTQTWTASKYIVLAPTGDRAEPGRIVPAYAELYPITRAQAEAATIRFRCGYVAPFTSTVANPGVLTPLPQLFDDDDVVRVSNSGGAAPTGLTALITDYYVVSSGATTMQLSATSGGAGINVTGAGTGTHFVGPTPIPANMLNAMLLVLGDLYANRERINVGNIVNEMPTVAALLRSYTVVRF
jgi:uncharacterized phiE125 gp8 family phage protein